MFTETTTEQDRLATIGCRSDLDMTLRRIPDTFRPG